MTVIGKKTHKARISGKEIIALRTYSEVYIQKTLSWPIDESPKISHFEITFDIPLTLGAPDGKSVSLLAGIKWNPGHVELSGETWSSFAMLAKPPGIEFSLDPYNEDWLVNLKLSGSDPIDYLSLQHINPSELIENYPDGVPNEVAAAAIRITYDQDVMLLVAGEVQYGLQSLKSSVSPAWLDPLSLFASYSLKSHAYTIHFRGTIDIDACEIYLVSKELIELDIDRSYDSASKSWAVSAGTQDVRIANLYQFFARRGGGGVERERDAVMNMIARI
ncbi:MAG: hypothetical protein L6R41_001176 [Letrouitia leprolyta]|nr:MAG: hypothetical protein L6R41_001176 [Letrouitia leprolyta]